MIRKTAAAASFPKKGEKAAAWLVVLLCWGSYFAAYIGRADYNAVLVGVISSLKVSNERAGLVSSFFYVAYGIGNFINGIISEKVNSKTMIGIGLLLSFAVNISMPFMTSVEAMKYFWLINGLAQSTLWANIIKIYTTMLPASILPRAVVLINTVGASGTMAVYALSALCLGFAEWRVVFYVAAAALLSAGVFWFIGIRAAGRRLMVSRDDCPDVEETPKDSHKIRTLFFVPGFFLMLMGCVANGALRDGILMWAPTFIKSAFSTSEAVSVLVSLALPMLQISGAFLCGLFLKKIKDLSLCAAVLFFISASMLALLRFSYKSSLVVTLVFFAAAATIMTAVNVLVVSFYPVSLRSYGSASAAAGIADCFVYIGSSLSSVLFGWISDGWGWDAVIWVMAAIAAFACVMCLAGFLIRKKEKKAGMPA